MKTDSSTSHKKIDVRSPDRAVRAVGDGAGCAAFSVLTMNRFSYAIAIAATVVTAGSARAATIGASADNSTIKMVFGSFSSNPTAAPLGGTYAVAYVTPASTWATPSGGGLSEGRTQQRRQQDRLTASQGVDGRGARRNLLGSTHKIRIIPDGSGHPETLPQFISS